MFLFRSVKCNHAISHRDRMEEQMGYDLHITRKKNWDSFEDEHGPDIYLGEWVAAAKADRDMRIDGFAMCACPMGESFVMTIQASRFGRHGFALSKGNIVVKESRWGNPPQDVAPCASVEG